MTKPETHSDARPAHLKTLRGRCDCGAVTFEADVDLTKATSRCNCGFCRRAGLWGAAVHPSAFRLLSGEDELTDYQRGAKTTHLTFCKRCGVRPFSRGDAPWMGGPYVGVNLNCVEDLDTKGLVVLHFDGAHDDWSSPRAEVLG